MKISQTINYPLGLLGLKLVRLSKLKQLQDISISGEMAADRIQDIANDKNFIDLYEKIKDYTMVGIERCYALYQSVNYILKKKIAGDFVECGVWKGGSCMLIAYLLQKKNVADRKIYMYDTFEGMTKPGEHDGAFEREEWSRLRVNEETNNWCLSMIDEVKANMQQTKYPAENIYFIKGKVEDTLPGIIPSSIALLRLDTDWYESTRQELTHLYPLLAGKGVLLIDDYGAWQGAKKATDEYFANENVYLHRVDFTGRLIIK